MRSFNGKRKVKIQIESLDLSNTNGYFVYHEKRLLKSGVSENEIAELLTEKQFKDFQNGDFLFTVSAQSVFDTFELFI